MRGRKGIIWILGINIAIWIIITIASISNVAYSNLLIERLSLPSSAKDILMQPWSILTYMFTQYSSLHIICNMVCLLLFGIPIAKKLGSKCVVWIYIIGGIAGATAYTLYHVAIGSDNGYLCGASAAVLSIMSAALMYIPQHPFRLPFHRDIKLKWLAAFCCIILIISADGGSPVSGIVHSGGMIFGLLIGIYFRRRTLQRIVLRFNDRVSPKEISRYCGLMEKVRMSGYLSLSNLEKEELIRLSEKIKSN